MQKKIIFIYFFVLLILIAFAVGGIYILVTKNVEWFKSLLKKNSTQVSITASIVPNSTYNSPLPKNTDNQNDNIYIKPTPKTYTQPKPVECYRFKIPHLDGSNSNLCYNLNNYQTLTNLYYQYSSAKTFYEFHIKSAQDYQRQYEKTGSSIYLEAKKRQEENAAVEKQKMDSALSQMSIIENQGY